VTATLTDLIHSLPSWVVFLLVFLAPCLEASAFVGFVFPGEIAVFVGGVVAYQGRLPLAGVMAAAVVGAIVGDSIGYWVGRRYGRRLLRFLLGRVPIIRKHLDRELDRAEAYLKRRGGRAVFLGRYTAALRVLVPGLAGMSDMHYPRFLFWNVIGGATWAVGFVLLGYAAGAAWRDVERYARNVGLILLALVVAGLVAVRIVRRYRRNPAWARAVRERLRGLPPVPWIRRRFPRPVSWLRDRFRPGSALGLPLTSVVLMGALCAVWFGVLTATVADHHVTYLDHSVQRFVLDNRSAATTSVARVVTWLGSSVLLVPILVIVGVFFLIRKRDWRPGVALVVSFGGSVALYSIVKHTVARPRPPTSDMVVHASGYAFTSGHATGSIALWGMLAVVLWASGPARIRPFVWPAAVFIVGAVGASRLYLGVHWFTDVVGGYALGGLWLAIVVSCMLAFAGRSGRTDTRASMLGGGAKTAGARRQPARTKADRPEALGFYPPARAFRGIPHARRNTLMAYCASRSFPWGVRWMLSDVRTGWRSPLASGR
jgi:undecaprenyl-diphosphatase